MQAAGSINRFLAQNGLGTLDQPGLPSQLACLVRDDAHFGQVILACEPEKRRDMYEAMAPHLDFKARPLHEYLIEAQRRAEVQQLPVQDADGNLHPFRGPEIRTVQRILDETLCSQHLTVTCRKCTKTETFHGVRRADAIAAAREAGWAYDDLHGPEPFEICPDCPGGR